MKTLKTCLLTLSAIMSFAFVQAQTADEIIAKNIEAMGGRDKMSQVKAIYMESNTEVMGNQSATKTTVVNGKGFKSEADFNGQQMVQVVSDKGGWQINPFAGSSDATAIPDDQYKLVEDEIYISGRCLTMLRMAAK